MLTFISFTKTRDQHGRQKIEWQCACECGNITKVNVTKVLRGDKKQCGCLKESLQNSFGLRRYIGHDRLINEVVSSYRKSANDRNYTFNLTRDRCIELFNQNCTYCNKEPSNHINRTTQVDGEQTFMYNGIDRVDNSIGYEDGNVVSCCFVCNWMKRDMQHTDFIRHIRAIYNNVWVRTA